MTRSARWLVRMMVVAAFSFPGSSQPVNLGTGARGSGPAPPAASASHTVRGRVVNALDGSPIARALVNMNGRSALTDARGRFEFAQFIDPQVYVQVTRPGFSPSADGSLQFQPRLITDLDAEIELSLYPDVVISGLVTGPDGLPLTRVPIRLERAIYDGSGVRWQSAWSAVTDSRGEYRFLQPPGRLRLEVQYVSRSFDTGETILPLVFPDNSASSASNYLELASGTERRIDLRPRVGQAYPVRFNVDQETPQRGLQLFVSASNGELFQLGASRVGANYQIMLPNGSYQLKARIADRDDELDGSSKVTVAGHPVDGLILHMAPAAELPIELVVDRDSAPKPSSALPSSRTISGNGQSFQEPDLRLFNLRLHNVGGSSSPYEQEVQARQKENKIFVFKVPPGRYRLEASIGGAWFVESATEGVTNLMTSDLVVAAGAAGVTIRIVASNAIGNLQGKVAVPPGTNTVWVYFLPRTPSLSNVNPIQVNDNGRFYTSVPAGNYTVLALDHRLQEDLREPGLAGRFSGGAKTVEVTSGIQPPLSLELARESEPGK